MGNSIPDLAETGTVSRNAWKTDAQFLYLLDWGAICCLMSAVKGICKRPSYIISSAGSSDLCFNALFLQCVVILRYSSYLEICCLKVCLECLVPSVKSPILAVNDGTWKNVFVGRDTVSH